MEKGLRKIIIGNLAAGAVTLSLAVGVILYTLIGRKELKMQERQDSIVEMLNQNPLTRISSSEEFNQLYELEQKSYDEGLGIPYKK